LRLRVRGHPGTDKVLVIVEERVGVDHAPRHVSPIRDLGSDEPRGNASRPSGPEDVILLESGP
jgi:hypothetical protein